GEVDGEETGQAAKEEEQLFFAGKETWVYDYSPTVNVKQTVNSIRVEKSGAGYSPPPIGKDGIVTTTITNKTELSNGSKILTSDYEATTSIRIGELTINYSKDSISFGTEKDGVGQETGVSLDNTYGLGVFGTVYSNVSGVYSSSTTEIYPRNSVDVETVKVGITIVATVLVMLGIAVSYEYPNYVPNMVK
ncbi:MAG: hypothetical protein RR710_09385, partial [Oscillospiraceae bacterium]